MAESKREDGLGVPADFREEDDYVAAKAAYGAIERIDEALRDVEYRICRFPYVYPLLFDRDVVRWAAIRLPTHTGVLFYRLIDDGSNRVVEALDLVLFEPG